MKRCLTVLVLGLLATCTGCEDAPVVTGGELERLKAQWREPKVSIWYYVGSKDGYHYFTHVDLGETKTYRITDDEQRAPRMTDTFPLTSDRKVWRVMYWGVHAHMKVKDNMTEPNHASEGIRQPADRLPKPSM